MKILVHTDSDAVIAPMVYGFMDYYTSRKTKVYLAGLPCSEIDKTTKKVMNSVGIDFADCREDGLGTPDSFNDYDLIISLKDSDVIPEKEIHKVYSLDYLAAMQQFLSTDRTKSDYKKLRKQIHAICEKFVETHIEGKHMRKTRQSA
jgi:protein-tyrosine-phosphatase